MKTFSGKDDKTSGVRTKHIYSDAHNLRQIRYFNGKKVGMINYKMHFETCENADVTNTLRPQKLTLESFDVKEPYAIHHQANIELTYKAESKVNPNELNLISGTLPYTFRVVQYLMSNAMMLVEKTLDLSTYGIIPGGDFGLYSASGSFYNMRYQNDYDSSEGEHKLLKFDRTTEGGIIFYFDTTYNQWRSTGVNMSYTSMTPYTSIIMSYPVEGVQPFVWDTSLRYSADPYGYQEMKLLEIIDLNDYNILIVYPNDVYNEFYYNFETYNSNFKLAINAGDVLYYGLGKNPVIGIVDINIDVSTITEAESMDSNVITESIPIIQRVEIFPTDTLTSGISFPVIYNQFIVYVYIPYKTNQDLIGQYLGDNCTVVDFRYFLLDFSNIKVTIKKEYSDRTEYLSSDNFSIVSTSFNTVMEKN